MHTGFGAVGLVIVALGLLTLVTAASVGLCHLVFG
jgi:hypothetical protein